MTHPVPQPGPGALGFPGQGGTHGSQFPNPGPSLLVLPAVVPSLLVSSCAPCGPFLLDLSGPCARRLPAHCSPARGLACHLYPTLLAWG